jgi:hypothetical protein
MKVKIKKVYYCDFCRKHSLRSLVKHEEHCTANPNRKCGLCKKNGVPTEVLDAGECPLCTFSMLRQSGKLSSSDFNLEEELKKYWNSINADERFHN